MEEFLNFCVYVRTAEGTTSDSLVYVFGCCVFCRGGDDGDI